MKKILVIVITLLVIVTITSGLYAGVISGQNGIGNTPTNPYKVGAVNGNLKNATKGVWKTVVTIVQIASVACVVFAGLRYMFSSSDQRADIKQGLMYLTIGAVLVFGSTLVIKLVAGGAENVLK